MKHVSVLYLDMDGTVRKGKTELGRFVNTADDVEVFEQVPELLQGYKELGWRIIGVSNQGGIGLGYMTAQQNMEAMVETNRQCGGLIDRIFFCPHKPESGCDCRKPKPGMIIQARKWLFQEFDEEAPVFNSVFVGDMDVDSETARQAGLEFILASSWREGYHLDTERLRRGIR